jgi:hypothetical protein
MRLLRRVQREVKQQQVQTLALRRVKRQAAGMEMGLVQGSKGAAAVLLPRVRSCRYMKSCDECDT